MKKLSNFAKSNIFLWLSVAVAVSEHFVTFPLQTTLWGVTFAIGTYFWGKSKAERDTPKNYNVNLYADKQTVVG